MRCALGVILLMVVGAANAVPVTWTFNDFEFDDGGVATGSFVYDADTNTYSDISVTTTTGSTLDGVHHAYLWSEVVSDSDGMVFIGNGDHWDGEIFVYEEYLILIALSGDMTNSGGSLSLQSHSHETTCAGFCSIPPEPPKRYLISGSISAVPIPAAVWLFGSGLGILGWFRRRQS
jgi:hypothetical protein